MCGLAILPGRLASCFEGIQNGLERNDNLNALYPELSYFVDEYVNPCKMNSRHGSPLQIFTEAISSCFMDIIFANAAVKPELNVESGNSWLHHTFSPEGA